MSNGAPGSPDDPNRPPGAPGQPPYGQPPQGQGYSQPPGSQPQAHPAPHGAPPESQPYGQPPGAQPYGQPPGAQPYGQPPVAQPGPYGQPPGAQPYGQPPGAQPGPYGQPPVAQPGPYGQPPGAYPAPYPPRPPKKKGPTVGKGLGKVLGLGVLGLVLFFALRDLAYGGYGMAAFVGVCIGMCAWGVANGVANLMKKSLHIGIRAGVAVVVAGICTVVGPPMSNAAWKSKEREAWAELTAEEKNPGFRAYRWVSGYKNKIKKKFRRPTWKGHWMRARVSDAVRDKSPAKLRRILQEIGKDKERAKMYLEARQAAKAAFGMYYERAISKLMSPARGAKKGAFAVDPELRTAFRRVLLELTESTDANVYVAFSNRASLEPPEGTTKALGLYRADPKVKAAFPGGAPVIDPGQAFSVKYNHRRRQTFITAMSQSFAKVFDSDLLSLQPLTKGKKRTGNIVMEVSSHIYRLPTFYVYTKTDTAGVKRVAGLLFGIGVAWGFKLYSRSGKVLYAPQVLRTMPAKQLRMQRGARDPRWAIYSVLMDSAYYNYARTITGKFGLVPPPVKAVFRYQDHSVAPAGSRSRSRRYGKRYRRRYRRRGK